MMEKERKQWVDERKRREAFLEDVQSQLLKSSTEMDAMREQISELEEDMGVRE